MDTNIIYNEDSVIGIKKVLDNTVDLTITSPPYNFGVKYDSYNDKLTISEYRKSVQAICDELYRVTKVGGRVCINIPLVTKDHETGKRISMDQLYQNCLDQSGFLFREKIIWNKKGVTKRNAWGSFMLPSCPWIVYPTEVILIYHKLKDKREIKKELATVDKDEFIECSYNVWWVEECGAHSKEHPAVMSREVAKKLIDFYSYENDIILDPYLGSGTTCLVAKELNRKYIGFEISNKYYNDVLSKLNA